MKEETKEALSHIGDIRRSTIDSELDEKLVYVKKCLISLDKRLRKEENINNI